MSFLKITFNPNRVYGLDILRTLAILFVVYGHGGAYLSEYVPKLIISLPVLPGVAIFFVLSGFLIGRILIKLLEAKDLSILNLVEFWKRRWFRTLPTYFLILTILIVSYLLFKELHLYTVKSYKTYFLFLQNFNTPHPAFFPEAWSLSIEEWFYFLTPLGLLLFVKVGMTPRQSFLLLPLSIIIMSIGIRYYRYFTFDEVNTINIYDSMFRKQVITRLDSIMYGILGAYFSYYYFNGWVKYKNRLLFIGITLLLLNKLSFVLRENFDLAFNSYFCVLSFSVSALGTLLLLPFLSNYKEGKGKLYRIITIISLISYSMYLVNYTLVKGLLVPLFVVFSPAELSGLLLVIYEYIIFWSATVIISILIYKYYEAPITKLRDKVSLKKIHNNPNTLGR